jgi:cell division protein FtsL
MAGWEVRPSDPRRAGRVRLTLLLLILAVPLAFFAGAWWQARSTQAFMAEYDALQARLSAQERELDQLRQSLAVLSSGEKVAQQANEQNRLTIKLLEEQIFKQQQDLAFYKGVLAPASRREGLRIRAFELQATDTPRRFRYKLLLSRVGKDDKPLQGQLRVTVEGRQAGKDVSLALADLTLGLPDQFSEKAIVFTFKHFQAIPEAGRFAELKLPEGFEPRQVRVRAEVKGEKPLERTFKWIDEE